MRTRVQVILHTYICARVGDITSGTRTGLPQPIVIPLHESNLIVVSTNIAPSVLEHIDRASAHLVDGYTSLTPLLRDDSIDLEL